MEKYIHRCRYTKLGLARFASHRDLIRLLMRALRRADIPTVFTEGYHQRPRIAFSPPLKTGLESRAEYFDVVLLDRVLDLPARLNSKLPEGIEVVQAGVMNGNSRALAAEITAAEYRVFLTRWKDEGWRPVSWNDISDWGNLVRDRCQLLLEDDPIVERSGKKGTKKIFIRKGIYELGLAKDVPGEETLRMVLALGGEAHVQPGEVLEALVPVSGEDVPTIPVVRWELYTDSQGALPMPSSPETD